ncbi:PaaI family thioesterase [Jiangella endophytica]|uniref:PaaI family thioesterase n=1 Tax=Jiangella endophytica TaxID=1623398 RepID=UPI0018E53202|nr:hotdog domain-containing protein [Jiangella endophytica]
MTDRRADTAIADPRRYWGHDTGGITPGGSSFVALVSALRELQDLVTCSDPSSEIADSARALIEQASTVLAQARVEVGRQYSGLRGDVAGRGHPLSVPIDFTSIDDDTAEGTFAFSPFYLGGGVAAHGGAIALAFDEVLGRLANAGPPSRTAYLHVDYRRVLPVGIPLQVSARIIRRENRKLFVTGEIRRDGVVAASGEGLWVVLRDDATPEEQGLLS